LDNTVKAPVINHIEQSIDMLRKNFSADTRPWIVAYSGGKDSTLTLQLVYELLLELPSHQRKPVHVLASDTQVEAPNVEAFLRKSLREIQAHADFNGLPLTTHLVTPDIDQGFWFNLIGKGYPPPTRWFRWCTSKMKIKPVRKLVESIAEKSGKGSVILLLGTRTAESSNRSRGMQARASNSRGLNPHHEIPNALVLAPISHWSQDQVWEYLMASDPAPWGGTHDVLWQMYRDAGSGECPVITDLNSPSCGGSRFGC
jgi:DNA sulfur modification protein DndC